jgi:glycine/D-amino acid oxidase-like deaminating enzyme
VARTYDLIIVGAGILGLAGARHILRQAPGLRLLVLDRLPGPGQGNSARSAAAFRGLFTSPVNRQLSRASISFYEALQANGIELVLKKIGYLWLLTSGQALAFEAALQAMALPAGEVATLERQELARRLPGLAPGDLARGILGHGCGILNQSLLTRFYAAEVASLGGQFRFGAEVRGFIRDGAGAIKGVEVGEESLPAATVIVATGAWMGATLAAAGLTVPVVPLKRQLFAVKAQEAALARLLRAAGFNPHGLLPFTILPGGAYLRPATGAFLLGYAEKDRLPGLEDDPQAEMAFFLKRLRPQVARYFPAFREATPSYAWAGHYADHPPDRIPFVDRLAGAILVGGASGSGIMKADALGRVAAGLYFGRDRVELADGRLFQVADLALAARSLAPEELVI